MEKSTNRSPSPVLTRPRPNPNSRNSETNSTIRRSFNGNPFAKPSLLTSSRSFNTTTPANSPADLGRRRSLGKEGVISGRGNEEKENENRKSAARVSSSPAKCTKNFMAPTISAASKFTPSPRKRVLAEKNELVRTSISFSNNIDKISLTKDAESDHMGINLKENTCFEVPLSSDLKENACIEVPSNSALKENESIEVPSSNCENPSESLSDLVNENCVDCDKIDPDHPSLPPYDPTTNYLSPRPLFLRYKPNPRVEVFLNKQVLDFEESFLISETLSSDDTTEETQSRESLKESDDDDDTISSVETEPITEPPAFLSEPIYQPKIACKPKFFTTRSRKSITLLLVFLIACLCMSFADSPVISSPVFDPTYYHSYDPFEAVEFAKANFDGVVRNLKQWSSNTISYLSTTITHFSRIDERSTTVRFSNTSASQEESLLVDSYLLNENQEQNGWESVKEDVAEIIEPLSEVHADPMIIQTESTDSLGSSEDTFGSQQSEESHHDDEDFKRIEEKSEIIEPLLEEQAVPMIIQTELTDSLRSSEDTFGFQQSEESHHNDEGFKRIEEKSAAAAAIELEEFVKPNNFLEENDLGTPNDFESNSDEESLDCVISTEMVDPEVPVDTRNELESNLEEEALNSVILTEMVDPEVLVEVEENLSAGNVVLELAASILVLGLIVLGSIFIIYTKKQSKASTDVVVEVVEPPSSFVAKKKIYEEDEETRTTTLRNLDTEMNESSTTCPSQMSSFEKSASYSKRREVKETTRTTSEASRRESLASSDFSMGSPSYGSFTTYERIPKHHHHGSGDEEIVTPVRRSSRIRSKAVTYS